MSLADKQAFPVPNDANVNGQMGMTLLEHYAGLAMQGLYANSDQQLIMLDASRIALLAVDAGKALIAELEKEHRQ